MINNSKIDINTKSLKNLKIKDKIKKMINFCAEVKSIICFNDLLSKIIDKTYKKYLDLYPKYKSYDLLINECKIIIEFIIYLLSSSSLFQIRRHKIDYETLAWISNNKKGVKNVIEDILKSNNVINCLTVHDINKYVTLIYKILKGLIKNKTFFTDVHILAKNNTKIDFRKLSTSEKNRIRNQILNYYKSHRKVKQEELAEIFLVEVRNVKYVINEYKKKPDVNFSSYKDKKRGPEESYFNKISAEIFLELITNMVSKVPLEFNLNYASWSGEAIVEYLQERHQLNVTRDYVYYFLNRFEVNSKFGKRINPSKDYEAMQAFIKDKYRQICEEAKTRGEVLIFGDETSCQKGYHQRGFAPKGKRAIVMHTTDSVHTGHSLFNLIGPGGFFKMFLIKGTFDAIIFKNCLKKLHEEFPTIKFLLILDNSRVHHAKLIKKWSERLEKKEKDFFRIEWLPAYCPELNPVEYLNNDYKTFIKKKGEISKDDVINISKQYISSYVDGDEKQMRQKIINFFKAKDCSYSLDIYNEVFKK